ncbi:heterogeneous nuclear ribonucleoprotein 1-like [Impatiens glandulifera]|uniref:heterogeneous nuclear ribonucleoprotein 1-like n=1 Tax=Impatiens glandulifera TaxID=253017 RepID=UPI001FB0EA98|nr:heterogeneous nuclear ribonucleoprotein 1-like [Impatiens glandulifera]XP_047318521.1 heterogeneous nuclear ribonucleoprotein 1-like [Impatiens glandulifera]
MEIGPGKLFIGGISWETNDVRLKEYFQVYGEVMEAVIMKDRITGRARGFGFVVFADSSVADRVVKEKHIIDGRMVEAKKAIPRDDQSINVMIKNNGIIHPVRTKKIFVGGLASTVTETEFKRYFDQFGTVTDVVVMYDHNTQRPRGFGFITYDIEEAVERVLMKTFHELNGKMVEVKKAVPKELSPTVPNPNRSHHAMNRVLANLLNTYTTRLSPITVGENGYYGMGLNFEPGLNRRVLNSFYGGSSSRFLPKNQSLWLNNGGQDELTGSIWGSNYNGGNSLISHRRNAMYLESMWRMPSLEFEKFDFLRV